MSESMIEFRGVHKSFGDEVILRDVSFRVDRGETIIILGASGSGKSTILKLILGLISPESGTILVGGQDITPLRERDLVAVRRGIGMVFQEGALFDSLSVRENVGYRLFEEDDMDEDEIEKAVRRELGFVGLEDAIDKMPAQLSGGMKRRVGIARALLGSPPVVLYDEPTAGLDPVIKRTILDLMIRLRDIEGVTSVFVTHDLQAASIMANEYAVADADGRVSFRSGSPDKATERAAHNRFVMLQDGGICFEGDYHGLMQSTHPYIREFVS
ncbi:MAG: ATP-binding cassette domain-containing protein [Acidobacteriota bacterium]|jgi:phospholipid/cholesterol/gamma-HCH transport system ATP-binding protein|nr:ATP-binding cassette domain-containing protein [Acidobacteriota bacterium]